MTAKALLKPVLLTVLMTPFIWAGPAAAQSGEPALVEAARLGDLGAVNDLLGAGADPDAQTELGNTALIYAARDGRIEIAKTLIAHGASVNWIDGEGVTPLILAAFKDHGEVAALLLAQGADRSIRDRWGRNALDYSLRRGAEDSIARLLAGP
jgi:ankyrin repeat protein